MEGQVINGSKLDGTTRELSGMKGESVPEFKLPDEPCRLLTPSEQ
ncbi:hypothetical protein [[Clostridium] colinum]|nr:hypothetical protein [[Clostridium] colinum]